MEGRGKERWKIKERKGREGKVEGKREKESRELSSSKGKRKVENWGEEGEKNWGKKEMNKEEREEKKGDGWEERKGNSGTIMEPGFFLNLWIEMNSLSLKRSSSSFVKLTAKALINSFNWT